MGMDKFYTNSFDDSVKSAFDKADNELSASGNWAEMQQLLDKEMPVSKAKRNFFFWFFSAAILLGGYFAFQLWKNDKQIKNAEVSLDNKPVHKSKEDHDLLKNQNPTDKTPPTDNKNLIEIQNKTGKALPKVKPELYKRVEPSLAVQSKKLAKEKKISRKGNDFAFIDKSIATNKTQEQIKANSVNEKENNIDIEPKLTATNSNGVALKPVLSDSLQSVSDTIAQPDKSFAKQRVQTKWQWNLSFAPDFLLANIQPLYRPGISLGLGINYQLSPKWALRTGLLYNYTPVYESGQTYIFKPSPNLPAYNTIELQQVKGSLHVFEVPLSVRFTANPDKKVSFLGSIGLSSLFFVKQRLTYDLLLNGNTPLLWNSENDSDDFGESHILSNLVIGTGLSIKTKRNTSIEVEPVFKLPLEELGEGHNKLGTIAIYLHVKRPVFKQKK